MKHSASLLSWFKKSGPTATIKIREEDGMILCNITYNPSKPKDCNIDDLPLPQRVAYRMVQGFVNSGKEPLNIKNNKNKCGFPEL